MGREILTVAETVSNEKGVKVGVGVGVAQAAWVWV